MKKFNHGWRKAPTLQELKADLDSARPFRDQAVSDIMMRNEFLEGKIFHKKREGYSNVQPKLIKKHAEWRYPSLSEPFFSKPDLVQCLPRTANDRLSAKQNETILNYQWNNLIDKQKFFDTLIKKDVDEGVMIVRVGWESQYEEIEEVEPIYNFALADPQQAQEIQRAAFLQQKDPYSFNNLPEHIQQAVQLSEQYQQPIYPYVDSTQLVISNRIIKNQPTFSVCDVENCYPDPSCKGILEDAKFFVYSFQTCKADLKKTGLYENIDDIIFDQDQQEMSHLDHFQGGFRFEDEARKQIIVYEYWGYYDVNGDGSLTPILAAWCGDVLLRLEENPFPDKSIPFVSDTYRTSINSIYGETDGDLLQDNQAIIGAVTRGAIDLLARSANAQEGMVQNALDAVNKRRYLRGENYEFRGGMGDPRNLMIQHTYPEIPSSVFNIIQMQQAEAESLTAVKPFSNGLNASEFGRTARAASGLLDATSVRAIAILRRIINLFKKIVRKQISMNSEFLSDEEIIRVTDDDFVIIRRDDLAGNLDIKVELSTAEEDQIKAQELAFMLQTVGNSMPLEISQIILSEIASLRKMPNLAKRIEEYRPQPDPFQEQMKQIELQKAMLELQLLQTQIQGEAANADLANAKTQETIAKANVLGSDADLKDLNFLEQQSGLKHQRELDQNMAQARGNMALEVLKSRLNPNKNIKVNNNGQ